MHYIYNAEHQKVPDQSRRDWLLNGSGDLYLAEVGQALYEEVDLQRASSRGGENYGWNRMEGFPYYNNVPCDQTGLTLPLAEYAHSQGNCSITGGYAYWGAAVPALSGAYLCGDYCSGRVWAPRQAAGSEISTGTGNGQPWSLADVSLEPISTQAPISSRHRFTVRQLPLLCR